MLVSGRVVPGDLSQDCHDIVDGSEIRNQHKSVQVGVSHPQKRSGSVSTGPSLGNFSTDPQ